MERVLQIAFSLEDHPLVIIGMYINYCLSHHGYRNLGSVGTGNFAENIDKVGFPLVSIMLMHSVILWDNTQKKE